MFFLHHSNQTEHLLAHLSTILRSQPLASVFAPETFLIQSAGMERMLAQHIADESGCCSHFQFAFPSNFFNSLTQLLYSPEQTPFFERSFLCWIIDNMLRSSDDPIFAPVHGYLRGANLAIKRFQMAQQLAQIFDQYQIMRPDMLNAWRHDQVFYFDEHEYWQKALWRKITDQYGHKHRGVVWLELIQQLNRMDAGQLKSQLPQRLSIFGIHSLPPIFLQCLQALSRHCDIHIYLLEPTQTYWADLPGKKRNAESADVDAHPLLVSLGQQGREFQQLLLEQVEFDSDFESFDEHDGNATLQHLQNAILNNTDEPLPLSNDHSISIHSCHSRLREVEVIKDLILDELEKDNRLNLRDIIVMAPDIQLYEPFIHSVFNDIQHSIADRNLRLSNSCLDALLLFLQLCRSRFGWREVLDLLEQPNIHPQFGLTEADLELISYWVKDTYTRWAASDEHKKELGLPPLDENTWRHTLNRLLMGYASSDDNAFIDDILPYPAIEGLSAEALGGLNDFMQCLFNSRKTFQAEHALSCWQQHLLDAAEILLSDNHALERQQLNDLLLQLSEFSRIHDQPVPLDVIIHWLETTVSEQKTAQGFLRGQLTFCSMLPMRAIPFKIIVLLGMNDGEFPAIDRSPVFNLLAHNYRVGDRSRRHDDRYQFLETLLSARKKLIISYIGQSLQHNEDIPPSIVISELVDVLEQHYGLKDLIIRHPLQAFSQHYFNGHHARLFSFNNHQCAIARQLRQPETDPQHWWQGEIHADDQHNIELAELFAFFRHPQKYFFQRQLDLRFTEIEQSIEEREIFNPAGLENYLIKQEWLDHLLHHKPWSLQKLQAQGRWPQGASGKVLFHQVEGDIRSFADKIMQLKPGSPLPPVAIDISVMNNRIIGKLEHCHQHGLFIYRLSNMKGKDFILAWLHHLLINQIDAQPTFLICEDKTLRFNAEKDTRSLEKMLLLYQKGQTRPDAFFTEAAFDYIQQSLKTRNALSPLQYSVKALEKKLAHEAELRRLYPDKEALASVLTETLGQICDELLIPAWKNCDEL